LSEVEGEYRAQERAQRQSFQQAVANDERARQHDRSLQSELGVGAVEWERHRAVVKEALRNGAIDGVPVDLDERAVNDPEAYDRILRYGSGLVRQVMKEEVVDRPIKDGIIAQEARSISAGLTENGQPVRPLFLSEPDPQKTIEGAIDLALARPGSEAADIRKAVAARRSIADAFTVDGHKTHPDLIKTGEDGLSASQRLKREQQRQR
jgi:hypothetical protein